MGGSTGDGLWHAYEVRLKTDTNGSNGIYQVWIDGKMVVDRRDVNFNQEKWYWFEWYSNQSSPSNGGCAYVYFDDLAISVTTPSNRDSGGNPFIGPIGWNGSTLAPAPAPAPAPEPEPAPQPAPTPSEPAPAGTLLFEEKFDDGTFSARGWYDNTSPVLTSGEVVAGSTRSVEFRFPAGATKPLNGNAMRKKFTAADAVYLSYYVKYSSNWTGSNRSYHPHEFYLLTNKSADWSGLARTPLTAYIEQNEGTPQVGIQDGTNIDQTRIGQNLTSITESRAVAGCNGDSDGYGAGECYSAGGTYVNGKFWRAGKRFFSDSAGPYYKNDWHRVEVFLKLNSVVNGKGVADGVIQYWFDGEPVLNHQNVIFRTGANSDMKFNQFVIAPWIGDGSPVDQTFWIDNLTVATARPAVSEPAPAPAPGPSPAPSPNTAPVAHAGLDQTIPRGSKVTLDGSRSADADGDPLTFTWTFISKPVGSGAVLSGTTSASPTFTADAAGDYVLSLVVHDGKVASVADTVTIKATSRVAGPKNLRKTKI